MPQNNFPIWGMPMMPWLAFGKPAPLPKKAATSSAAPVKAKAKEKFNPFPLMHKQLFAETSFIDDIIYGKKKSPAGAMGLAQAMPEAIVEYKRKYKEDINPLDPKQAIKFHKRTMADYMERPWVNSPKNASDSVTFAKALAAYNYGPGNAINVLNAAKAKGIDIYSEKMEWLKEMPKETRDYVNKIFGRDEQFEIDYAKNKDKFAEYYKKEGGEVESNIGIGVKPNKSKYDKIPGIGLRYPTVVESWGVPHTYYSPSEETIYFNPRDRRDPSVMQHEMFHHWQKLNDQLSVPEEFEGPIKKPSIVDENPYDYYNRRIVDSKVEHDYFVRNNPEFLNIPFDVIHNKQVNPAMYQYADYAEGEAQNYQDYVKGGGRFVFPEYGKGGLIKRKDGSYSKRGLWDNIRANRGSGRKPTAEMLRQERKIRAAEKKEDGGWLDAYDNGGDVPHDYIYANSNVSSFQPGTSPHPMGITNVPDSPCGPGFTIDYDETGNPVCKPIAQVTAERSVAFGPARVYAGASPEDYRNFNSAIYRSEPLIAEESTYTRFRNKRDREAKGIKEKSGRENKRSKAISSSDLHREPFLSKIGDFFRNIGEGIQRCLPGDDCYKFAEGGPIYNWIPENYPRVGARYAEGGQIENQKIPDTTAYEFGNKFIAYPDPTLTNYQMGTPKAPMYAAGGNVSQDSLYNMQRALQLGYKPDETGHWPSVDYQTGEWLKAKKHPTAWMEYLYGYTLNPELNKTTNVIQNERGNLQYVPKKYAAGATVWTDQDTPTWAAGSTTPTDTQNFRNTGSLNTNNYRIGDVIPTGMDYKTPAAGTYDYNKDIQPPKKMRLYAPQKWALGGAVGAPFHHGDVLSKKNTYNHGFANGGYVPMYKSGGFFRQAGEFAFGALEGTLDTVTGGLTDSLTDMGHDALAKAAGTTYEGKEGQRLKRLHGAGKIGGAITGAIVSGNVTGAIGQGAEGTNDILQASPNASDDLKKWGGFGLNLAQTASGFMGGGQGSMGNLNNADKMAAFGKSGIGQFSQQAGKIGQGYNQYGNMLGDPMSMMSMFMGANGGYIPSKKRAGIPYAISPGISNEGMYVGPTTQRGITFENGGPITVYDRRDPKYLEYQKYLNDLSTWEKQNQEYKKRGEIPIGELLQSNTPAIKKAAEEFVKGNPNYEGMYGKIAEGQILNITYLGKKPSSVNKVELISNTPYMPMRGIPEFSENQIALQKVQVPQHTIVPSQYMDMRGEWSDTLPTAYKGYTPEQLGKMGYRQSNIKKADGGDVMEVKPMLAAGPSAGVSKDPRQPKLGVVGMGYAGGKYNPYGQVKGGMQGSSVEAGLSPYIKMNKNLMLNPSIGGGVSTEGLYGKAGLTGMYNLPRNLNFDLYGSAEYMQDARGGSLPIEAGLAWSDVNPLVRTGVSYDPLQKTAGISLNLPIGAEKNLFKYKAKPKTKARFADGGNTTKEYTDINKYRKADQAYQDSLALYNNYMATKPIFWDWSEKATKTKIQKNKEAMAITDKSGIKPVYGQFQSGRKVPWSRIEENRPEEAVMAVFQKPSVKPVYNPNIPLMSMRGMPNFATEEVMPQGVTVGTAPSLPSQWMGPWGENLDNIPEHLKIGSNWRTSKPSKKQSGGWLDNMQ